MCLDSGPFVVGDTEIDAMTNPPTRHDHVVAEGAFLDGPNARQRLPRLGVERVGLELHPDAVQGLEGMTQLQVFRFRVDGGLLPGRGNPGTADLHTPVVGVDIEITGRTDGLGDGPGHRDETDHQTGLLFGQFRRDVTQHILLGAHGIR